MKQVISKRLVIAGLALLTVPSAVLAQKEKDKKENKEVQSIVITRTGDKSEKMVIEVEGDKVKVNGKDVKDLKDVNVHVNTMKSGNYYRMAPTRDTWAFGHDGSYRSLLDEDENRAMLGVNTDDHEKGAEIESITEGSAADKAGLKKGDVITKVGDKKIEDANDLTEAIKSHKPSDKVAVTYLRGGKEQKTTAELGKWKGIRMNAMSMPRIEGLMDEWKHIEPTELPRAFSGGGNNYIFSGRPRLGLSIQDTDEGKGVKVLEVEEESNAAKAGIQKDDIIMSIDDKEVKGTEDVMRLIREDREKYNYNFKVQRGGKMQTIEVKFPKKLKKADL